MSTPEVDFHTIGRAVFAELERRAANPETARDLPGTHLMQLAASYQKLLEKEQELRQQELEQAKLDPLEMIDIPGISLDRRVEILAKYLDELEEYWRSASERMSELMEEVGQRDTKVVPEVQEVVSEG